MKTIFIPLATKVVEWATSSIREYDPKHLLAFFLGLGAIAAGIELYSQKKRSPPVGDNKPIHFDFIVFDRRQNSKFKMKFIPDGPFCRAPDALRVYECNGMLQISDSANCTIDQTHVVCKIDTERTCGHIRDKGDCRAEESENAAIRDFMEQLRMREILLSHFIRNSDGFIESGTWSFRDESYSGTFKTD